MRPLVSVIVPIYMVDAYLPECIESIQHQTYENLDIVLVDDGSKDNSGKIADEYASNDQRINVIHKENGGVSDARNAGIENSKGDYIVFVDPDDYVHPKLIEILMEPVENKMADMSVCSYVEFKDFEKINVKLKDKTDIKILESNAERFDYFYGEQFVCFVVPWDKLYPKSFFSDIRYPKGKIYEDAFITYKILEKAKKIAYIDETLYFYRKRTKSIMSSGFNEKYFLKLDAHGERIDYYIKRNNYLFAEREVDFFRYYCMHFYKHIVSDKNYDVRSLRGYLQSYRNIIFRHVFRFPIPLKKKLGYIWMAVFPESYIKHGYDRV
ncbi:glycosyltransferase family 2 protein [Lachnospiraceae bacterium C1.1]|nr:glycosyltransferase [Lachnospiraceae bacterium C1.1]